MILILRHLSSLKIRCYYFYGCYHDQRNNRKNELDSIDSPLGERKNIMLIIFKIMSTTILYIYTPIRLILIYYS